MSGPRQRPVQPPPAPKTREEKDALLWPDPEERAERVAERKAEAEKKAAKPKRARKRK